MNSNLSKKNTLINIGTIIVFFVIIFVVIFFLFFYKNKYEVILDNMEKYSKDYVSTNNILIEEPLFLTVEDLKVDVLDECSLDSGVIVSKNNSVTEYTPYLTCENYVSDIVDNKSKYIELNGPEVIVLRNNEYVDEGYSKIKPVEVEVQGEVLKKNGVYTINYVAFENGKIVEAIKRIVIVITNDEQLAPEKPTINGKTEIVLLGDSEVYVDYNSNYVEPGYNAFDSIDGDITKNVIVSGGVITNKVGTYELVYSVTNSRGNSHQVKRLVHVVKQDTNLKVSLSLNDSVNPLKEVIISANVSGSGFKKMILPNGNEVKNVKSSYTVYENGTYTFSFVNIYDEVLKKTITVNNIDNIPPVGTCNVIVTKDGSTFNVSASDNNKIIKFNYIINGKESGFLDKSTYKVNDKATSASVILRDVVLNTKTINCSIKQNIVDVPEVDKPGGNETDNNKIYEFIYNNDKPFIKCNSYTADERTILEKKLSDSINKAGYGTRAGVVEAARFLVGGLEYKIPYLGPKKVTIDPDRILGMYAKKGLNIAHYQGWGCSVLGYTQGMDCTNFVTWAFVNGGVQLKNVYSTTNTYKSVEVVNKIKVGDLMLTPCGSDCKFSSAFSHVGIVIGIDSNKIYVAEAVSKGITISEYSKNNMPKNGKFSVVRLFEYSKDGNITNMWK